ncbi:hypothetical protein N9C35_02150 [Flavobacteriaceae bacterium]|nr:hypothetical protein [Flavobacteriaceae bacterium]
MRRISHKWNQYFIRRKKKYEKRLKRRGAKRKESKNGKKLSIVHNCSPTNIKLTAPENLNLTHDADSTVKFFNEVRKIESPKIKNFSINFKTLRSISPSAALMLTAEMDRLKIVRGTGIKVIDFKKWDPYIKILLRDMGMYNLLRIPNINEKSFKSIEDCSTEEKFVEFRSGNKVSGMDAVNFRSIIKEITSFIPEDSNLQIGLTEAMDNALNHAYPDRYLESSLLKKKQWWMLASFNPSSKKLTVMFYDQGIGIPDSLPVKYTDYFNSLGITDFFNTSHSKLIQISTTVGRSATKESHRGKGLDQIKSYISNSNIENGYIKIYSNKGKYFYGRDVSFGEKEELQDLKQKIKGTLIEWQVCLKNKL